MVPLSPAEGHGTLWRVLEGVSSRATPAATSKGWAQQQVIDAAAANKNSQSRFSSAGPPPF
jgi:hypothetical protein